MKFAEKEKGITCRLLIYKDFLIEFLIDNDILFLILIFIFLIVVW